MALLDHVLYALLWLSFGVGHSLLAGRASRAGRAVLHGLVGRWHRVAYNLVALAHVTAIWVVGRLVLAPSLVAFERPSWLVALQAAALLLGLILLVAGARRYDLARFSGLRPENPRAAAEPLLTEGIHGHIRHPLYAAAYLLLAGAVTDELALATAVWAGLYLAIGTAIEERRLLEVYGEAYRDYRRQVPALVPLLKGPAGRRRH